MLVVVLLIITALASMYHKQIVTWLTPFTKWVYECVFVLGVLQRRYNDVYRLEYGWLVPIAVLFVISFPPVTCYSVVLVPITHLFASAIWSRNRLRSLWAGMGLMEWVWNRCCGHFPRRGWQFLVRSYNSGLYSAY